jgi:hypothetical protein
VAYGLRAVDFGREYQEFLERNRPVIG